MTKLRSTLKADLKPFAKSLDERFPQLAEALVAVGDSDSPPADLLTAEQIAPLVEAASNAKLTIATNATGALSVLVGYFKVAQDAVAGMSEDSRSHVRLHAIISLGSSAPQALQLAVLGRGLRDKSAKVREKAADWALNLYLPAILPDLEAALTAELDPKTHKCMDQSFKLLRDGYFLTPLSGGRVQVTIAIEDGSVSARTTEAELQVRGVENFVSEFLKSNGYKRPSCARSSGHEPR